MTFPNPFETNPIPGLQGVAESLDLDSAEVQRLATALYRGAVEPLEKDKRKVAALKGALVRPVAQSLRAEDSRTLTGMGQRLRNDAAAQVADTDAEIMLLASRLGARQSAGELTSAEQAMPVPAATTATCPSGHPPCPGAVCASHPLGTPSPPSPGPGWTLVYDGFGDAWYCPPHTGAPLPLPSPGPGPTAPPSPVPPPLPPPSPPAPCEPCPVGVPPGGTLAADPAACRKPDNTTPQAVYIVPWLGAEVRTASAFSECGRKALAESFASQYPADRLIAAFAPGADYDAIIDDTTGPIILGYQR